MTKDYQDWHKLKTELHKKDINYNFSDREVWWCSIGENIGFEEDGKNHLYERPVLVLKKYNKSIFIGLPLSTKIKASKHYHKVSVGDKNGVVILSQIRAMSANRLQRRIGRISKTEYKDIRTALIKNLEMELKKSAPQKTEEPRAPSGDLYFNSSKDKHKSQE